MALPSKLKGKLSMKSFRQTELLLKKGVLRSRLVPGSCPAEAAARPGEGSTAGEVGRCGGWLSGLGQGY